MSSLATAGLLEPFQFGRGFVERVIAPDPGAGNNLTFKLDSRYTSRLLACMVQLVTSATVANRWLELRYTDSDGGVWHRFGAGRFQVASLTQLYAFDIGRGASEWAASGADLTPVFSPLADVFLEGTDQIRLVVGNLQAGDVLSGCRLSFERLPTGPRGYEEGAREAPPARLR